MRKFFTPPFAKPHPTHAVESCHLVWNHRKCPRCGAGWSLGTSGSQCTFNGIHYYVNGPKFWKPCPKQPGRGEKP